MGTGVGVVRRVEDLPGVAPDALPRRSSVPDGHSCGGAQRGETTCSRPPTRPGHPGTSHSLTTRSGGRLNVITHLLSQVPYEPLKHRDVTLPKRQRPGGYREPDLAPRAIPVVF